ncbi:hypothetical protein SLA2020_297070 [Shorea laevis]
MATLFHLQNLLSLSASSKPFFSSRQHYRLSWRTQQCPPRRNFTLCAALVNKPRRSRKIKSDEELCNEVRAFTSMVGLPEGHVPTLKEFSKHGRKDLANLVRRRGYKLMRELLASSTRADLDAFNGEKSLVEKSSSNSEEILAGQNEKASNEVQDFPLSAEDVDDKSSTLGEDLSSDNHNSMKESTVYGLEVQSEKAQTMVEDLFPSTSGSIQENCLGSLIASLDLESDNHNCKHAESLPISTLEKEVSKFIQNGDLDKIEDSVFGVLNGSDDQESKAVTKMEREVAIQSINIDQDCSEHVNNDATTLNGSSVIPNQADPVIVKHPSWGVDTQESERLKGYDVEDLYLESIRSEDGEIEIDHLRFMLQQKKMEMSSLKEQIEMEKIALSSLQTKAETKIKKAQELVSEKDAELQAAEESLSGLEEVQIEYSGEGEIVEVTGSFNGWHHRIKMDPQPSSGVIDPLGSRKSKMWSTVLWLYPGTYEIKFIVDGQWTTDPQRESVNNGGICNNILRVDG